MPKTMTFDRAELEIIRKALRTELKKAQTAVDREQAKVDNGTRTGHQLSVAIAHRDRLVAMYDEAMKPVMVERVNLMSGEKYMEAEDTPNYCSPASEAYWSM